MYLRKIMKKILMLCLLALTMATASAQPDSKAKAIADKVMQNMGGEKAWAKTRFLAWTFNNQYQVWDKKKDRFRWEKDSLVAIIDTQTKEGKAYIAGNEVQNPEEKQKMLERAYALYINNSYWLVMPFKLQDPGVTLTYISEDKTMDGAQADVLEMTFEQVGLTPQNKYRVWVDQQQGLVTQWAFYRSAADAEPTFTRRWAEYRQYGKLKLASNRSNPQSDFNLMHIASPVSVEDKVFNSPTPIEKL